METERILIISAGSIAMLISMLLRRKTYPEISIWKIPLISILLTLFGVLGAMLMFYVENGRFGGTSFFGAILFTPILMVIVKVFLKVPYGRLMDLCAPAECLMLAILKLDCLYTGCCSGRFLTPLGFRFPSQISELIASLVIMLVLMHLEKKPRHHRRIYAYYLVQYGVIRFILNVFRDRLTPFIGSLPPGHFWSLVSIVLGLLVMLVFTRRKRVSTIE